MANVIHDPENAIHEFEPGMTYLHMGPYVEDGALVTGIMVAVDWPNAIQTDDGEIFERVYGPLNYEQYNRARGLIETMVGNAARIKALQQGLEKANNMLWDIMEETS